jgi:hypothetical protein
MKAIRSGLLAALVLVTAVVVIASPAFATPNITASSGTRAVSPFFTPIGSTTSASAGFSTDFRFNFDGTFSVTCRRAIAWFYVPATHTQGLVTSLRFGEPGRSPTECGVNFIFGGTIEGTQIIDPTTNSTTPSRLHKERRRRVIHRNPQPLRCVHIRIHKHRCFMHLDSSGTVNRHYLHIVYQITRRER